MVFNLKGNDEFKYSKTSKSDPKIHRGLSKRRQSSFGPDLVSFNFSPVMCDYLLCALVWTICYSRPLLDSCNVYWAGIAGTGNLSDS